MEREGERCGGIKGERRRGGGIEGGGGRGGREMWRHKGRKGEEEGKA